MFNNVPGDWTRRGLDPTSGAQTTERRKSVMSDLSRNFMRKNALLDLYAGCVTPWDRNILSDMGLPSDVVDPFASQDSDPIAIMNLTFVSLKGWIEDAKKAPYYTERFADLSKLVMKGVTTMGRGLVTLHNRGEDLSAAPMQIEDLISVGSYHFRKSYLGVVQFSAKRPEIGERLLLNQLRWADMLLRLYKTKEKLSEKPGIRCNRPEIKDSGSDAAKAKLGGQENTAEELPAASPFASLDSLFVDRTSSLASPSSLNEPAAFSAQRALTGFAKSAGRTQQAAGSSQRAVGSRRQAAGSSEKNEPVEKKNSVVNTQRSAGNFEKDQSVENKISADSKDQAVGSPEKDETAENIISTDSTQQADISKNEAARDPENLIPDPGKSESDPGFLNTAPPEDPLLTAYPLPDKLPETVKIMQNVFRRSKANGDGSLSFTIDEMRILAEDPIFADMEPGLTTDIRNALTEFDSG